MEDEGTPNERQEPSLIVAMRPSKLEWFDEHGGRTSGILSEALSSE